MQTASHRIWTHVAEFISYDDNPYTTSPSSTNVKKGLDKILTL